MQIEARELKARLDRGDDVILVDVREADEIRTAEFPNAVHIPLMEVMERHSEIATDYDKDIVVICHAGARSLQVVHFLQDLGYKNAKNLDGGIDTWSAEVDPSIPRY